MHKEAEKDRDGNGEWRKVLPERREKRKEGWRSESEPLGRLGEKEKGKTTPGPWKLQRTVIHLNYRCPLVPIRPSQRTVIPFARLPTT